MNVASPTCTTGNLLPFPHEAKLQSSGPICKNVVSLVTLKTLEICKRSWLRPPRPILVPTVLAVSLQMFLVSAKCLPTYGIS